MSNNNNADKIKMLEKELMENKQFFLLSLDMICTADINTSEFIRLNPAFSRTLGYSEDEMLKRPFFDFIHPDDILSTRSVIELKLKKGDKVINFENRYRCKDGTYKWLSWFSQISMEEGIIYAIARDISVSKHNEKVLKESNKRFKSLFNSTNDGICLHEIIYSKGRPSDYKILEINPKYESITGIKKEDAIGSLGSELYGSEEAPYLEKFYDVVVHKKPVTFETYFKPMDKHFKISVFTPGPDQFATVFQDITDQKRYELELKKTKKLLEETQSITKLGGWEYTVETNELIWTKETFSIHGISKIKNPVDLREAVSFYSSDQAVIVENLFNKALKNGEPYDIEIQLNRKDGKKIWVRTMGHPYIENGKVTRIAGNIIDITARKKAETEKETLQNQLLHAQKNQAIGTLAGGIAHDFNNILSGIFGYAQLAQINISNEKKVKRQIESIVEGAKRASKLIQQILTFSRQKEFKKGDLELTTSVKEVVKLLRSSIPTTIEIKKELKSKAVIWADPTRIHQMIMNLGTNAYQSMIESGGILTIKLEDIHINNPVEANRLNIPLGNYVKLMISDTGKGIESNILGKIFEPYYTTKETGEGTGLGLALVNAIVQEHNGFIRVKSKVGKGTRFKIYLPTKVRNEEKNTNKTYIPAIIKTGRILLVDDEEDILYTTSEILTRYGFNIITCKNGEEGLNTFKSSPSNFDLVITDMAMPKMAGDELARKIIEIRNDIPVILCTGFTDKLREEDSQKSGIKKYLQKPVFSEELLSAINELIKIPSD